MANKRKTYVLILNVPRLGIQLLGTFSSRNQADDFIKEHKVYLNAEYELAKRSLSVDYQKFVEVVNAIEDSNLPKTDDEKVWEENVKKILSEKYPDYPYEAFADDIRKGRRITKLDAMCTVSTYTVYETITGEGKHLIPQNI